MEHEELKNRAEKIEDAKIWEKSRKKRIYLYNRSFQQAGYITTDADDVRGRNSGTYRGLSFSATRPGNVNILMAAIDELLSVELEAPEAPEAPKKEEVKKISLSGKETEKIFRASGIEGLAQKIFDTFNPKGRTEAQNAYDHVDTRRLSVDDEGAVWLALIKIIKDKHYVGRPKRDFFRS